MNSKTISRTIGAFGAAALIGLGMATTVPHMSAQGAPAGPPEMGMRPGGPGGFGRGGRGGMMMGIGPDIDVRDLTDAQKQQVKAIRDAHKDEIRPLMERVMAARKALDEAVINGGGDLQGLANEVGAAEGQAAFQHAQIETEILAILTPEQKAKLQERRKEMEAHRAEMEQKFQGRRGGRGNAQ